MSPEEKVRKPAPDDALTSLFKLPEVAREAFEDARRKSFIEKLSSIPTRREYVPQTVEQNGNPIRPGEWKSGMGDGGAGPSHMP